MCAFPTVLPSTPRHRHRPSGRRFACTVDCRRLRNRQVTRRPGPSARRRHRSSRRSPAFWTGVNNSSARSVIEQITMSNVRSFARKCSAFESRDRLAKTTATRKRAVEICTSPDAFSGAGTQRLIGEFKLARARAKPCQAACRISISKSEPDGSGSVGGDRNVRAAIESQNTQSILPYAPVASECDQ